VVVMEGPDDLVSLASKAAPACLAGRERKERGLVITESRAELIN